MQEGPLQPLKLGSSSDLEVGQKVFAIGNPFGLDHTLTTGVWVLARTLRLETTLLLGPAHLRLLPWSPAPAVGVATSVVGRTECACTTCLLPLTLPGVISGTGREISSGNTGRPIQDVIQTDAAINPGGQVEV